ncbi:protein TPX2 [Curcuma longa]|uniref:protein TPX2 n=1 Tax=Curcuma longa TaxID=136217 RepID=UPI003D9DE564
MTASGGVEFLQVDEVYEYRAPRFFDFSNEESEEDVRRAELWFETSLSYDPSPFVPRIRESRSVQLDSLCDFGNIDEIKKVEVQNGVCQADSKCDDEKTTRNHMQEIVASMNIMAEEGQATVDKKDIIMSEVTKPCVSAIVPRKEISSSSDNSSSLALAGSLNRKDQCFEFPVVVPDAASAACTVKAQRTTKMMLAPKMKESRVTVEPCTPKSHTLARKGVAALSSSKNLTATRTVSIQKPSGLKEKSKLSSAQPSKNTKAKNVTNVAAKNITSIGIAQENQAIKRQKLDDGRSKQIHNLKNRVLLHKSRLDLASAPDVHSSGAKDDAASIKQRRPALTLTRPKDPELETARRVRAVRIKSSVELEEEMLAKMPKFRARPLNKKIFEAPAFPLFSKSSPQTPVFQEFHFKTMERANQHADTSSIASSLDSSVQKQIKPLKLTEPKFPHLETTLRARPPKIKSSEELEREELEKMPKFKAWPLNKKILESKGDIGLFCNSKPQITVPEEFHFATNDRLGPSAAIDELFDKLSLHPVSSNHEKKEVPKLTIPNPFHLHTEERGLEKEKQFVKQLLQKELEEERARIPKANPYPYTTDFPVMPPKPEPKQCTKPEGFQLESLIRHEEELQRRMEEKERAEREEAQRRIFRAQPILKDDPLPLPERERKPLTEVQEFALHVDHRAVQRSEFDKVIKEKELTYKRLREEQEFTKMMEEEKVVKQMRRTMVPHARPLPSFENPFIPQKSTKEATKPKSPDLRVNYRVERWQAFHMR